MSTIKVKRETLLKLTRLAGRLTEKTGKRMTYDDVIRFLISQFESKELGKDIGVDETTQKLLSYIDKSFPGAGSEDFREYEYEDLGD
ncbi:MAG: hypothetical protein ACTSXW_02675 [Candidatus Baldrarchaeia archaeon]